MEHFNGHHHIQNQLPCRGGRLHSLRFKTWLYFFFTAVFMSSVVLFIQFFFFSFYYRNVKRDDIKKLGENLKGAYSNVDSFEDFTAILNQSSLANDVHIVCFSFSGQDVVRHYQTNAEIVIDKGIFVHIHNQDDFVFVVPQAEYEAQIIYAMRLGTDESKGDIFLYMTSEMEASGVTKSVLKQQMFFSSALCLLLSLLLSWFISSKIALPISHFSKTAKKLGNGDFSVRFFGNGVSEIEDLASTLNYATAEMHKTEILRREIMANVSHDLRTPLTMVKAYAEMIRDISGNDAVKRLHHSQVIIDEADRLTNLVEDIQNLSKLQSGTDILNLEPVDLSVITKTVLERFTIYSEKEGYEFISQIDKTAAVIADSQKIEQVLYNLIGNAVNYTGGDKKITVKVFEKDGYVYFSVTDTGKGIAESEIEQVWDKYYRIRSKRARVGTGLGLSIVKSILTVHNAKFGVDSEVGKGSTFYFALEKAQEG